MTTHFDFCVVGAGPSGLTTAYKLLQGGASVVLIERQERIGGLAKSYNYDGHIFDTGPKRFHTDDPVVLHFLEEVARGDMLRISRSTEVHFMERYFEWPLGLKDVWRMPIGLAFRSMTDLLQKRDVTDPVSFHQYIRSKYGESLYRTFFEPYTAKFLRWDVEDIHSDWASTGINRTVIDSRIKTNTSLDLIKNLLLPSKINTEFLYPSQAGFGGFYEKLLGLCKEFEGFTLIAGDSITSLNNRGEQLEATTKQGSALTCDNLVWTGNLNSLSRIIGSDVILPYLNTVFYNVICRSEGVSHKGAQWIYVSRGDSLVSRITCMNEFAPYTCPAGYYNFICEITDSQQKPRYFERPGQLTDAMLRELTGMGFLRGSKYVDNIHVNPVIDTYPVYHRGYLKQFGQAAATAKKFSRRIHLLGRCGAFWYNNNDHSIRFAIEMARKLLGQGSADFDYRAYFGGVHGRAANSHGK